MKSALLAFVLVAGAADGQEVPQIRCGLTPPLEYILSVSNNMAVTETAIWARKNKRACRPHCAITLRLWENDDGVWVITGTTKRASCILADGEKRGERGIMDLMQPASVQI